MNLNCIVETTLHKKKVRVNWKDHAAYRILYVIMRCAKYDYADVSDCELVDA